MPVLFSHGWNMLKANTIACSDLNPFNAFVELAISMDAV